MDLISFIFKWIKVSMFANGLGDRYSIPGRVMPKTQKMVLDAALLNTEHYKVRMKGKVEQSRERTNFIYIIRDTGSLLPLDKIQEVSWFKLFLTGLTGMGQQVLILMWVSWPDTPSSSKNSSGLGTFSISLKRDASGARQ